MCGGSWLAEGQGVGVVWAEGLGEEVADAEDDAGEGAGAGAVEDDAALGEQGVEAAGDHAFEEGELVGVVGVEGGAVDAGGVGDLLDGELVEVAGAEEVARACWRSWRVRRMRGSVDSEGGGRGSGVDSKGTEAASGLDSAGGAMELGDGGGDGHGNQSTKNSSDCVDKRQMLYLSLNRQLLFRHQLLQRRFTHGHITAYRFEPDGGGVGFAPPF